MKLVKRSKYLMLEPEFESDDMGNRRICGVARAARGVGVEAEGVILSVLTELVA